MLTNARIMRFLPSRRGSGPFPGPGHVGELGVCSLPESCYFTNIRDWQIGISGHDSFGIWSPNNDIYYDKHTWRSGIAWRWFRQGLVGSVVFHKDALV